MDNTLTTINDNISHAHALAQIRHRHSHRARPYGHLPGKATASHGHRLH